MDNRKKKRKFSVVNSFWVKAGMPKEPAKAKYSCAICKKNFWAIEWLYKSKDPNKLHFAARTLTEKIILRKGDDLYCEKCANKTFGHMFVLNSMKGGNQ